ncbi:MAG TPA: ribosome-associated translation inhibitor RaiA [bacterium]|nr:ribosome-associated translation inhibitor RaiA [bacterium]
MARSRKTQSQPLNVMVQGKNIDVTPSLKEYAEEKVGRITRYFEHVQEAQVVLSVQRRDNLGKAQVVEVTVWGDGIVLRGVDASEDMYASIDGVSEKLRKQIEKFRSKFIEKRRTDESRKKDRAVASAEAALRGTPDAPRIVRTKRFAMKPMTPEEAAMQMELLGHDFFVFRNTQSLEINVLYRRANGDYGLIEPQS